MIIKISSGAFEFSGNEFLNSPKFHLVIVATHELLEEAEVHTRSSVHCSLGIHLSSSDHGIDHFWSESQEVKPRCHWCTLVWEDKISELDVWSCSNELVDIIHLRVVRADLPISKIVSDGVTSVCFRNLFLSSAKNNVENNLILSIASLVASLDSRHKVGVEDGASIHESITLKGSVWEDERDRCGSHYCQREFFFSDSLLVERSVLTVSDIDRGYGYHSFDLVVVFLEDVSQEVKERCIIKEAWFKEEAIN